MKKNVIRLTESELRGLIQESVKKILSESMGGSEVSEYIPLDNLDLDDTLLDFFDTCDRCPEEVEVTINYTYEAPYHGDYDNAPYAGGVDINDWNADASGIFRGILPNELYGQFIDAVNTYMDENLSDIENEIYEYNRDSINSDVNDYYRYDD